MVICKRETIKNNTIQKSKNSQNQIISIENIPKDVLQKTGTYLRWEDLYNLSLINKYYFSVFRHENAIDTVDLYDYFHRIFNPPINPSKIKGLIITEEEIDFPNIISFMNQCKNLKYLAISSYVSKIGSLSFDTSVFSNISHLLWFPTNSPLDGTLIYQIFSKNQIALKSLILDCDYAGVHPDSMKMLNFTRITYFGIFVPLRIGRIFKSSNFESNHC